MVWVWIWCERESEREREGKRRRSKRKKEVGEEEEEEEGGRNARTQRSRHTSKVSGRKLIHPGERGQRLFGFGDFIDGRGIHGDADSFSLASGRETRLGVQGTRKEGYRKEVRR